MQYLEFMSYRCRDKADQHDMAAGKEKENTYEQICDWD